MRAVGRGLTALAAPAGRDDDEKGTDDVGVPHAPRRRASGGVWRGLRAAVGPQKSTQDPSSPVTGILGAARRPPHANGPEIQVADRAGHAGRQPGLYRRSGYADRGRSTGSPLGCRPTPLRRDRASGVPHSFRDCHQGWAPHLHPAPIQLRPRGGARAAGFSRIPGAGAATDGAKVRWDHPPRRLAGGGRDTTAAIHSKTRRRGWWYPLRERRRRGPAGESGPSRGGEGRNARLCGPEARLWGPPRPLLTPGQGSPSQAKPFPFCLSQLGRSGGGGGRIRPTEGRG